MQPIFSYQELVVLSAHILFTLNPLWESTISFDEVQTFTRHFRFCWSTDHTTQVLLCDSMAKLWDKLVREGHPFIDFCNGNLLFQNMNFVIFFNFSKLRVSLGLSQLSLPLHTIIRPNCLLGPRFKHILNPINFGINTLSARAQEDIRLLTLAREGTFGAFFDAFIIAQNRHRYIGCVGVMNFRAPEQRLMLFSHFTVMEFRGIRRYFSVDHELISNMNGFLHSRTLQYIESLRTNYFRHIQELTLWDGQNNLIPNIAPIPEPPAPQNIILIPDGPINNDDIPDSGREFDDEISDEV